METFDIGWFKTIFVHMATRIKNICLFNSLNGFVSFLKTHFLTQCDMSHFHIFKYGLWDEALTSGRLNDIVKSHTKPKVQGGPFLSFFSH